MSEKKFEVIYDPRVQTEYFIYDNENKISRNITDYPFDNEDVCSRIVMLLNELSEENEQLRKRLKKMKEENKRLKTKQKKKIKQLKNKLDEAIDEWDYWKTMTESYRKNIKLNLEECIIIQGDKKFKGKICKMVKYEDKLTIDLLNTEEVSDDD